MAASVAFVALQFRVAESPVVIDGGDAVNVTVGSGAGGGGTNGTSEDHTGSIDSAELVVPSIPLRLLPEASASVCPLPSSRWYNATVLASATKFAV